MSNIPPDLTHMPPHIKQMIVNSSDTETKFCQRALSQEFKCKVDKAPIRYIELKLVILLEKVQISRKITEGGYMNQLEFYATSNGYSMKNHVEGYEKETEGDYRKAAVAKLLSVFKHSKVSTGKLSIEGEQNRDNQANDAVVFDELNRILSEKPFQLRVENLTFNLKIDQQRILSVLRYLKPITLNGLEVAPFTANGRNLDVDEIVQTEQWMGLENVFTELKVEIPLERLSHFNSLYIRLRAPPTETIVRFLETFLSKPTLELLWLNWSNDDLDTTRAKEYVRQFDKIPELCSEMEYCIKLGNNQFLISISERFVRICKRQSPN